MSTSKVEREESKGERGDSGGEGIKLSEMRGDDGGLIDHNQISIIFK